MLDIKLIRANPELIRNNLKKRGDPDNLKMLDKLIEYDKGWRQLLTRLNELRHKRRLITTEIASLKKKGKDASTRISKARTIDTEITTLEKQVNECEEKTRYYRMRIPNLLHESVPIGKDEHDNVPLRAWGAKPKFSFPVKDHIDLGLDLDIMDIERAGKVAGARFFYLKREGVMLDMAFVTAERRGK